MPGELGIFSLGLSRSGFGEEVAAEEVDEEGPTLTEAEVRELFPVRDGSIAEN